MNELLATLWRRRSRLYDGLRPGSGREQKQRQETRAGKGDGVRHGARVGKEVAATACCRVRIWVSEFYKLKPIDTSCTFYVVGPAAPDPMGSAFGPLASPPLNHGSERIQRTRMRMLSIPARLLADM